MILDWQRIEVQSVFAGITSPDMICRQDVRELLKDLDNGYRKPIQGKCNAPDDVWQLYIHSRFMGIEHCRVNGVAKVTARHRKELLRQKTAELYKRLNDPDDMCAEIVGNGLDNTMLTESDVMDRLRNKHNGESRYNIDIKGMNYVLYNWYKGDVMLLVGLSNTGKTSFALRVSYFAGKKVLYYGVDMSVEALGERIIKTKWYRDHQSNKAFDNSTRLECDRQTEAMVKSGHAEIDKGIRIYNCDSMTLEQIEFSARHEMETFAADVLIIDYAGRIDFEGKSLDQWREEQKIARSIKGMAKRLNIRVIALAQFNSMAKKFEKPESQWISGSKEFISASDVIVSLWQDKNEDGAINYSRLNYSDDIKNRDSGTHGDFVLDQFGTWLYEEFGND